MFISVGFSGAGEHVCYRTADGPYEELVEATVFPHAGLLPAGKEASQALQGEVHSLGRLRLVFSISVFIFERLILVPGRGCCYNSPGGGRGCTM